MGIGNAYAHHLFPNLLLPLALKALIHFLLFLFFNPAGCSYTLLIDKPIRGLVEKPTTLSQAGSSRLHGYQQKISISLSWNNSWFDNISSPNLDKGKNKQFSGLIIRNICF